MLAGFEMEVVVDLVEIKKHCDFFKICLGV